MNTKLLLTTVSAAALTVFLSCKKDNDQQTKISFENLPETAQTYVNTHFNGVKISRIIEERELNKVDYDVYLKNGMELEFFQDGSIESVDGKKKAIPNSVVPENILSYVQANYPTEKIVQWELDHGYQDVELLSGLELEFDLAGNFIRIDR